MIDAAVKYLLSQRIEWPAASELEADAFVDQTAATIREHLQEYGRCLSDERIAQIGIEIWRELRDDCKSVAI